jgi:hypothetical protein
MEPEKRSDWLVMLYLAGDNDLNRFARTLIAEAQRVSSTDRVTVVAEHDPVQQEDVTFRGRFSGGRWNSFPIGRTDGSPREIVRFIRWAKREYPARQRVFIQFDHGNGWQNVHAFEQVTQASQELRIRSVIRQALTEEPTDVLCFDSCLMAMIEIVYELRMVKYIVASQNVVPADLGWPYDAILRSLTLRPDVTPEVVATAMVHGFGGSFNGSNHPVTLSAFDVREVEVVVVAIDRLSRELIAACVSGQRSKVLLARQYAQSFGNPDYIDVVSFCEELQRLMPDTRVAASTYPIIDAMRSFILAFTRSGAPSISRANGVSIYFPSRPMSSQYDTLEFARPDTCMWASFLRMVVPQLAAPVVITREDLRRRNERNGRGHATPPGNLGTKAPPPSHASSAS